MELGLCRDEPTILSYDSAMYAACDTHHGQRTRSLAVKLRFTKSYVDEGALTSNHCPPRTILADLLATPKYRLELSKAIADISLWNYPEETSLSISAEESSQ